MSVETNERVQAFGMALRLARVKAGLHQGAVAKEMGVHPTAVSQWERGERVELPEQSVIVRLDQFLNAGGELAGSVGIQVPSDKRGKPKSMITYDATGLTVPQVREIEKLLDIVVKGYRVK
jgi:transcriptional regulator with XRE-family HTH domain